MVRERKITISVSSYSIVTEMIKNTLYQKIVILKNNFKIPFIPSFLCISIFFFFLFAKRFCLFINFSVFKKKKKKKKKNFAVMFAFFWMFWKLILSKAEKNEENDASSCMLKLIKSAYKTFFQQVKNPRNTPPFFQLGISWIFQFPITQLIFSNDYSCPHSWSGAHPMAGSRSDCKRFTDRGTNLSDGSAGRHSGIEKF